MTMVVRDSPVDDVEVLGINERIAENILARRTALNLSAKDLEEQVGIHEVNQCRREKGEHVFSVIDLLRYAKALGRLPSWFLVKH